MLLIPAIVLKGGRCEGAGIAAGADSAPAQALRVASAWITAGAPRLHVTDGETGLPGRATGVEVVRALADRYPDVPIQVAGSFRNEDDVERYLSVGAEYVLLDAKAAGVPHFVNDLCLEYPGHVLMTVEAKTGKAAEASRSKLTRHSMVEAARRFQQDGVAGILYRAAAVDDHSDIAPAVALAGELAIPVLASVGPTTFDALAGVCATAAGLAGAVLEARYRGDPQEFAQAVQLAGRVPPAE